MFRRLRLISAALYVPRYVTNVCAENIYSIVFTSKRLPLQPVSSQRNHQVADKFRKVSCLNVYGRKRGRVRVKQCMHSFHSLECLLGVFFDDYMSKLFPIFYLANFVCFYPSKYKAFPPSKPQCVVIDPCTCRDKKTCPLQEKCMTKDIIYKVTVTTSNTNSTKYYIGMTASTFKERHRNHIKSFNHRKGTQMTQNFRNIFGN